PPSVLGIEQPALIPQMRVELFHEEGVATGLLEEFPSHPVGRIGAAKCAKERAHLAFGKRPKRDGARLALANELVHRRFDALRCQRLTRLAANAVEEILQCAPAGDGGLHLPVRRDEKYGKRREMRREMLRQLQR